MAALLKSVPCVTVLLRLKASVPLSVIELLLERAGAAAGAELQRAGVDS